MELAIPLAKFPHFQTDSLEFVRNAMSEAYCNHRIKTQEVRPTVAARHNVAAMETLSLNYLTYGIALSVEVPEFPDFFLIDFPISGRMSYRLGRTTFSCHPGQGAVISPGCRLVSDWRPDSALFTLKIDRCTVEAVLTELIDKPLKENLRFDPLLDCAHGGGASLRALADYLVEELDSIDAVRHSPPWRRQLERSFIVGLLATQPHTYSADMLVSDAPHAPKFIRRAESFIRDNLAQPLTILDIVQAVGVPERTLFAAYRKHKGLAPMAHHRVLRMQAARAELLKPSQDATVASIACKWGFFHLGHFSMAYQRQFQELPSETLRSSR